MTNNNISDKKSLPILNSLSSFVFGQQNERLEYILDTFSKLSPEKKAGVVLGSIVAVGLFLSAVVMIYLSALASLQSELDEAFSLNNRLNQLRPVLMNNKSRVDSLSSLLQSNSRRLMTTVLDDLAKKKQLAIEGLPPRPAEQPLPGPLAALGNEARVHKVSFRIPRAGLQQVVDFIIEIEKQPNMPRVTSLKITPDLSDKLYVSADLEVEVVVFAN